MNPLAYALAKQGLSAAFKHIDGNEAMNSVIAFLLKQVVDLILGSDIFERVLGAVQRWSEKEISGLEKKAGVVAELEVIGLKMTNSAANFAVEAAIQYLKAKG